MNNLKDIHNRLLCLVCVWWVVILGFQWTIWRTYTTVTKLLQLRRCCYIRISMNNLKDIHNRHCNIVQTCSVVILGFQWTIWRTYTTPFLQHFLRMGCYIRISMNNLKDIHNHCGYCFPQETCCYIRISMNNLKDIHNLTCKLLLLHFVVILGFQWTIWLQKYRKNRKYANLYE